MLKPKVMVDKIWELDASFFGNRGISLVVLDVDNTLTTHANPTPAPKVLGWLDEMRAAGLSLCILSNAGDRRVAPFAKALGLDYMASGHKPLPGKLRALRGRYGATNRQTALIGDQLLTDVAAANLDGVLSILVSPMAFEGGRFFALKRWIERKVLRNPDWGRTVGG